MGAEVDTAGALLTATGVLPRHAVRAPMMAIAAIPLTATSFFMTSLVWLVVHAQAECLRPRTESFPVCDRQNSAVGARDHHVLVVVVIVGAGDVPDQGCGEERVGTLAVPARHRCALE